MLHRLGMTVVMPSDLLFHGVNGNLSSICTKWHPLPIKRACTQSLSAMQYAQHKREQRPTVPVPPVSLSQFCGMEYGCEPSAVQN
eukprot:COSAG01_NODE_1932_length_8871_cov_9.527984_8_plen_85_part_00